ncbi:hypothetical protein [Acinetobacter indicus]|uniref:hypothetical protein n=1 Tax=Acinetobacter indicus TaxID=756892 RepID=UPI0025749481|nr:hypothetical protein [Acinetobacter indicus]MDM1271889.1 hypothetical protein [Acinetobacter indicus]MDM1286749.1 hypothetical protein [Acinetobacter indicus]
MSVNQFKNLSAPLGDEKVFKLGGDIIADVGFSVFDFVAEAVAAVDVDCHSAADFVDVGFADSVDSAGFVD